MIKFGAQKINLHSATSPYKPHANMPMPGSADLCFLSDIAIADWMTKLKQHNITIIEGPVQRTGAMGSITSIYIRDPDGNLIEIANQI